VERAQLGLGAAGTRRPAIRGRTWARAVGIGLAILTAIAGFLFLAFTPVWGVVIVAVSVFAIWGMAHDGGEHSTSV
jgi:predicted exporter